MKTPEQICEEAFDKASSEFNWETLKNQNDAAEEFFNKAFMLQQEKIEILKEALEFYANHNNYSEVYRDDLVVRISSLPNDLENFGSYDLTSGRNILEQVSGKRAREALRKIEG